MERECAAGDGIHEAAWDDYHAARMLVGQACGNWDSEAAGRALLGLLPSEEKAVGR